MTKCETFNNLKKEGGTSLTECPYDKSCDGRECQLLRTDSRLRSPEDKEQETLIASWQINGRQKERLN